MDQKVPPQAAPTQHSPQNNVPPPQYQYVVQQPSRPENCNAFCKQNGSRIFINSHASLIGPSITAIIRASLRFDECDHTQLPAILLTAGVSGLVAVILFFVALFTKKRFLFHTPIPLHMLTIGLCIWYLADYTREKSRDLMENQYCRLVQKGGFEIVAVVFLLLPSIIFLVVHFVYLLRDCKNRNSPTELPFNACPNRPINRVFERNPFANEPPPKY